MLASRIVPCLLLLAIVREVNIDVPEVPALIQGVSVIILTTVVITQMKSTVTVTTIGVPLSNLYAGGINCLMMTLTGRETKGLQVLTERDLCSTTLLAAQPDLTFTRKLLGHVKKATKLVWQVVL